MLHPGASLAEIGQAFANRERENSEINTKVGIAALCALALPQVRAREVRR